jgi:hypothetical protein
VVGDQASLSKLGKSRRRLNCHGRSFQRQPAANEMRRADGAREGRGSTSVRGEPVHVVGEPWLSGELEQSVRSAAEEEEQGRRRPAVPVHLCSRAWPGGRRPVKRSTN